MAFDPTTLFPGAAGAREGEILEIRPENLWQDKAGTVAVTTDGDPVKRIDGLSVNGHHFEMIGTDESFTYHTDGTVHWLSGPGGDWDLMVSDSLWTFLSNSEYAVGAAVSFDSPSAGDQYFFGCMPEVGSGGSSSEDTKNSVIHCGARTGTTATIAHWFNDQDFSHTFPTATPERHICEYFHPGSEYTVDGTQIDVSASVPGLLDNVGKVTIFGRNHNSQPDASDQEGMDGDLYGMIIVVGTITAQEKSDIDGWLQAQIEGGQIITAGLATEASSATQVLLGGFTAANQAFEVDTATAVGHTRALTLGQGLEASVANVVVASHVLTAGLASETDTASPLEAARSGSAGLASETDTALGVTVGGGIAVANSGGLLLLRRRRRI